MGFSKVYRSLFNVEILHHYFLDEGEEVYDVDLDPDKMAKNLAAYQLSNYMDIQPSTKTITPLKNLRSRFVRSNLGFQVVTSSDGNSPFIPFSSDLSFDFILRIKDQYFENYTNITIDRSTPLFLSNVTPPAPVAVEEGEEEIAIPVNFCLLSTFETALTNGDPVPTLPMIGRDVDIEDIDSRELVGAFAIIRIHLNGEVGEITLTNGGTEFNGTLPKVSLMLENRSTTWKYHLSKDSAEVHATGELPLTKHGYISVKDVDDKQYPNPSVNMIYKGEFVGEDITKNYSRVFI